MSTQVDQAYDAARRFFWGRLKPLPIVRSIGVSALVTASWVISGALFGLASALILQRSLPAIIVVVAITGALSWLARGVANFLLACILMLVLISFAFQAAHFVFPGGDWSFSWLGPCAVAGVILLLLLGRRLGSRLNPGRTGALVEVIAALSSLILALRFVARVSPLGSNGAGLFVTTEDNDAWINLVGVSHNAHGVTELTGSSIGAFGPVVATYLAAVRAASSRVLSPTLPLSSSPKVVLAAYCLLIASAPIVAALILRRLFHLRSAIVGLLVWTSATVLIVSSCIVWMGYGSLSAIIAILLILAAAYLVSIRPRLEDRRTQVAWLASTVLLFGAGSAWVALVPLAGAAIAVCCFPVVSFALGDFRRRIPVASALLLTAAAMELELLQQYRDVVDPIGGQHTLFVAGGATPSVSGATQALILVLLFALVWLSSSKERLRGLSSERGFLTPLVLLMAYVVAVLVVSAWQTGIAAGYGPTKLQFVVAGVWVPLATVEIVSRLDFGRSQLSMVAIIVVAVVWVGAIENGPVYSAAASHWPTPAAKTAWYDTVEREVARGNRVLCLPVGALTPDPNALDVWDCSRFAASVQSKDDSVASTWRSVALGRLPVSDAVSAVRNAKDKPWLIVVIGPIDQLHNPKAWWAPIVKLPGLKFVPVSG